MKKARNRKDINKEAKRFLVALAVALLIVAAAAAAYAQGTAAEPAPIAPIAPAAPNPGAPTAPNPGPNASAPAPFGGGPGTAGGAMTMPIPKVTFGVTPAENPQDVALSLQILFLLTIISLAPSILIMMTSFTRIIIVLNLTRNALGTQQMPPNQILIGIALFMTFFIMAPVFKQINDEALQPYLKKQISHTEAFKKAEGPMREFMFHQTRKKDLALFVNISHSERPKTKDDVPTYVLIPAFIVSELQSAFIMGFLIYIPFLVIDMVVASTLMSMGMMMLPPIMISLPFKILIFVLIDGWALIIRGLVLSFNF